MTVRELIEELSKLSQDTDVLIHLPDTGHDVDIDTVFETTNGVFIRAET